MAKESILSGRLTENQLRGLKFDESTAGKCPYQSRADGHGLTLRVHKTGGKSWYASYRVNGKLRHECLGQYPVMTLTEAREKVLELKKLLGQGIDPQEERKREAEEAKKLVAESANTFGTIFGKWFQTKLEECRGSTIRNKRDVIEKHILPDFIDVPIKKISRQELFSCLEKMKGKYGDHTINLTAATLKQIFKFAIGIGAAELNPAETLPDFFKKPKTQTHRQAITSRSGIAGMLQKIKIFYETNTTRSIQVKTVMMLLPFLGTRITAMCQLEWKDVDIEAGTIHIRPVEGNKTKKGYYIYPGEWALGFFKEYAKAKTDPIYCFPAVGAVNQKGFIGVDPITKGMRDAGIDLTSHCLHGWRAVLKTISNELGVPDRISTLASGRIPVEDKGVEGAYSRAKFEGQLRQFFAWYENVLIAIREERELPEVPRFKSDF